MTRFDPYAETDRGPMRARVVAGAMALMFGVVAVKGGMVALASDGPRTTVAAATTQTVRRADIVDRNGDLLVTSVTVFSLYADPREIWDAGDFVAELATVFDDLDRDRLVRQLSDTDKGFVWVRRGLTPRQRQAVFELGLEGIGFREEARRAYPRGTLAGHVLGYAGNDEQGLGGVEFSQNDRLAKGGEPLKLTLDMNVQFALESELAAAAVAHDAEGGAGIIMDAHSGEVLGLASWPPIDPNRATELSMDDPARLNRAVGATYELGSVFKPLTIAQGLDVGAIRPSDSFDVSEPLVIRGSVIDDDHPIRGKADITRIIADSSNIGTVKIAQRIGERRQREFLYELGLLNRSPIELAGSAAPILPQDWTDLTFATMSYGHGIAVTPMAFLSAFSSLANDGEMMPPTIILREADERTPVRIMSAPTANVTVAMMRQGVLVGTGKQAEVGGYRVAGKTGTAEKPVAGGYSATDNITSFAAVFPADRPEYALIITLDTPKAGRVDGVATGSTAAWNAAPAVGRVIERIAPLLGVEPEFDEGPHPASSVHSVSALRTKL